MRWNDVTVMDERREFTRITSVEDVNKSRRILKKLISKNPYQ